MLNTNVYAAAIMLPISLASSNFIEDNEITPFDERYEYERAFEAKIDQGSDWVPFSTALPVKGLFGKALSYQDKVKEIRSKTGISNGDLGKLLGVSRQTIYNYLDPEKSGPEKQAVRRRVDEIYAAAVSISEIFDVPAGSLVKNYSYNGKTLFQLLEEDYFDLDEIVATAEAIASTINLSSQPSTSDGVHGQRTLDDLTLQA